MNELVDLMVEMVEIRTTVYSLFESNCYIIFTKNSSGALIIDPNNYEEIQKVVLAYNLNVEYIILTHEHYDHILALKEVQRKYGAKVIASQSCSLELPMMQQKIDKTFKVYLHFLGKEYEGDVPQYLCEKADITFLENYELEWNGLIFKLQVTPGHSIGSICVIMNDYFLFSGDSLLQKKEVVTKFFGGDLQAYKAVTIPFLKQLDSKIMVYPGHGKVFCLADKEWLY